MIMLFRNAFRYRTLLMELTLTGIKARYRETALGILWVIAQPLMLSIFCVAGFSRFWKGETAAPYPIFVYTGMVMWIFFSTAVSNGVSSLTQNCHLIRKIYFPREILVLAAVVPTLADFLVSFLLLLCVLAYYGIFIHWSILIVPVLLAAQLSLVLGLSFAGSMLDLIFRDVSRALPILLTGFMFLSPVLYPFGASNGKYKVVYYFLNPFAGIVDGFRMVLMEQRAPDAIMLLVPLLASTAFLIFGYRVFKYSESIMADVL